MLQFREMRSNRHCVDGTDVEEGRVFMCWNMQIRAGAMWLVVAVAIVFAPVARSADKVEPQDQQDQDYKLMKAFADTFDQVRQNYVKETNDRELIEAAIRGMISKLDPYSNYISPEELAQFNQQVEQEFGGIGIQVQMDPTTRRLMVMTPLPGTPAYKAGVHAGDLIMEVEGKSTEGFTLRDAVKLLKGKPGTKVTIGVRREGTDAIKLFPIERAIIKVPTVLGHAYEKDSTWDFMLDDERKIGFVRLTHFSRHSAAELLVVLESLQERGMRGLVLDLRFNPGGLLSQAVKIADMFIEKGKIVSTEGRRTKPRIWYATKPGSFADFPMAVLVNRYSASASEIVSACLQDTKRAAIVGERTWGKGSVQNVIEIENGQSALKLTTASYLRPSGENIHRFPDAKESDKWGVMPDEEYRVKFSPEEIRQYVDDRRKRDILSEEDPPTSDFTDRQLQKALEHVIGQLDQKTAAPASVPDQKEPEPEADNNKPNESKTPEEADEPKGSETPKKQDAKQDAEEGAKPNGKGPGAAWAPQPRMMPTACAA